MYCLKVSKRLTSRLEIGYILNILINHKKEEKIQMEEYRKVIIDLKTENNDRKRQIKKIMTRLQVISNENNNLRQSILNIKMNEGSMETVLQAVIQTSLFFLALTG